MSRLLFFVYSIPFIALSWCLILALQACKALGYEQLMFIPLLFEIALYVVFYKYCVKKRLTEAGRDYMQAKYIITYIIFTAIFCIYFSIVTKKE